MTADAADAAGDDLVVARTVTQDDLDTFADLSGDDNPIHVDPTFAGTTPFEVPVAHGMFLYGLVCAQARRLRPDTVQQSARMTFRAPTPVGADIRIAVGITGTNPDGATLLATSVSHAEGTGLDGTATLAPRRLPAPEPDAVLDPGGSAGSGHHRDDRDDHARPERGNRATTAAWWDHAVGLRATTTATFTSRDVRRYARLVDEPPEPIDDPAGAPVVPGPLVAGLVSRLLGVDLPGPGTNWLRLSLAWHHAAPLDRELHAAVAVTRVRPAKRLVTLATRCTGGDGTVLATGQALVLARDIPTRGHPGA